MTVRFLKKSAVADHRDPRAKIVHAKEGEELELRPDIEERLVEAGRAEYVDEDSRPRRGRRKPAADAGAGDQGTGDGSGEAEAGGAS